MITKSKRQPARTGAQKTEKHEHTTANNTGKAELDQRAVAGQSANQAPPGILQ